jgi:hypothetical protein
MTAGDDGNVHSRATLAPPTWVRPPESPASVQHSIDGESDLARHSGRAEEASLRAELGLAEDPAAQHAAASALARFLAGRERDLDEAIELALRALEIKDEPDLRKDVGAWLESLGEPGTAALVLRRLVLRPEQPASAVAETMVRVGVLLARADDGKGAVAAFDEAARVDAVAPGGAVPLELRGALHLQAGEGALAAVAYGAAADRHRAGGALAAELEDRLRAFEADRTSPEAAAALETALADRGKLQAAAEVRHAHLAELPPDVRATKLFDAMRAAVRADDVIGALGHALRGRFDTDFDASEGSRGAAFDDLLLRTGLLEPLAARLEVRAERGAREGKLRALGSMARLFQGPLASPSRAALAHVRWLAEDPDSEEALDALRAHKIQGDRLPLLEGLLRATASLEGTAEGRARAARGLAELARELGHGRLEAWAHEHVLALVPEDTGAAGALRRLGGPLEGEEARSWRAALEKELLRPARTLGLARFILGAELTAPDELEARAAVSATARIKGDFKEALRTTEPLLERDNATPGAIALAWRDAAIAGDRRARARALERFAAFAAPATSSLLASVAAEELRAIGDRAGARRAAELACRAEPGSARAVVELALAALGDLGRTEASAMERGLAVGFARGDLCEGLARALAELGEHDYAVAWTQRLVALRPGDRAAARALLERAAKAGDAARLGDSIAWLLPQPWPAASVVDAVVPALDALATLDPARAVVVARRALDVLGARSPVLAGALEACADRAGDRSLLVAIVERRIASSGAAEDKVGLLLRLTSLRMSLGETDSAVRAAAAALRVGADPFTVESVLVAVDPRTLGPDGELCYKECYANLADARAVAAMEMPTSRRFGASRAAVAPAVEARELAARQYRELGALRWDLAGDHRGAEDAWLRAARIAPSGGYVRLGLDLAKFAGARPALERLSQLVAQESDRERAGQIAAEAARAALAVGEPLRALELSEAALGLHPMLTRAIEVAERGAVEGGRTRDLSRVYDTLGERARGRFGRRAAHFRGARFFDQRNERDLALRHAAAAFQAVPSEGATFQFLARLAERCGERSFAVRAVEEVADGSPATGIRAAWLLRAAQLASLDEEGLRQRVDLYLKAAFLQPVPSTLGHLAEAAKGLMELVPDERTALQMRFARANRALTERLDGPDGARVALSFADRSLSLFDDPDGALAALERALGTDADLEEYLELVPLAPGFARATAAGAAIDRMIELIAKPFANVGVGALRLFGAIAEACARADACATFLMLAAEREPDDAALLRAADRAARLAAPAGDVGAGLKQARERFEKRVPAKQRVSAYVSLADAARADGRVDDELSALESAIAIAPASERSPIEVRLREALERAGRSELIEQRSLSEAKNEANPGPLRANHWTEVAHIREGRGDVNGATAALREAAIVDPQPLERWSALERIASLSGAAAIRAQALREIEQRVPKDSRIAVLRRLAQALDDAGDLAGVEDTWSRVLLQNPNDEEADHAIEGLIARRGDYAALAAHLARRAERLAKFTEMREVLRVVRLRRVAILEQRLGQLDDAVAELRKLAAEWPNNESVLRYLGDLLERQGDTQGALTVFRHLAALAGDPVARAELEVRAAQAAKASGDLARAEELALACLSHVAAHPIALVILASIARERGDDASLARWFAALAGIEADDPERRSARWIEASQAAARAGDAAKSLEYARNAADAAPHSARAQLFARGLEHRVRGPGSAREAETTIRHLDDITVVLSGDDAALAAFLRAEALDVAGAAPGAGLLFLESSSRDVRAHPLVAAGIAGRLAAAGRFAESLPHFQTALSGDLLGLRSPAKLALDGADAAARAGQGELVLALLERAATDRTTRREALRRLAHAAAGAGNVLRARAALEALLGEGLGDRSETHAQLGRLLFGAAQRSDGGDAKLRADAEASMRAAIAAATTPEQATQLRAELEAALATSTPPPPVKAPSPPPPAPPAAIAKSEPPLSATLVVPVNEPMVSTVAPVEEPPVHTPRMPNAPPHPAPIVREAPPSPPPAPAPAPATPRMATAPATPSPSPPTAAPATIVDAPPLDVLALRVAEAPPGILRARAQRALAEAHLARGEGPAAERLLGEALIAGDVEAGDRLAERAAAEGRASDVVRIRRLQVDAAPGNVRLLVALRDAALADRSLTHAAAVDHVLNAFDPSKADAFAPPPLSAQTVQPGLIGMLLRPSFEPIGEALALLWEGAAPVLGRDPASYAITGLERVVPGAHSPVARIYELSVLLLGTPNVPLYARRPSAEPSEGGLRLSSPSTVIRVPAPPTPSVALLKVASAMVAGDVREETPQLRLAVGRALAMALGPCALLFGLKEPEARVLWSAMHAAFGPPAQGKLEDPATLQLVATFWSSISQRTQRRISEILSSRTDTFEDALLRAQRSVWRVGLFICGDFGVTARALLAETAQNGGATIGSIGELEAHCNQNAHLADLVRLAVSPDHATSRFQPVPEGGGRATFGSGRYRLR